MRRLGPVVALLALAALVAPSPVRAAGGADLPGAPSAPAAPAPTAAPPALSAARTVAVPRHPAFADRVPASTTQVVRTISSHRWCRRIYCTVTQAWSKGDDGTWRVLRQFRSTIGPRGWGKAREGDLRSPVGVLRIAVTFSTSTRPGPMPWRKRLPTSIVSSQPGANYNTWLEVPGVSSGDRPSMRWGWWTSYNNARVTPGRGPAPVPGRGSGIFYHTSRPGEPWAPTEGCTQVGNPRSMHWLVAWLRPSANPRVVQGL